MNKLKNPFDLLMKNEKALFTLSPRIIYLQKAALESYAENWRKAFDLQGIVILPLLWYWINWSKLFVLA